MHPNDGHLRAFMDGELSQTEHMRLQAHLDHCPRCSRRIESLHARAAHTQTALAALEPAPNDTAASVQTARARFETYLSKKENIPMLNKLFTPRVRIAWVALAIVAILAASFSLPPVRAFADNFLGLFRIQQVSVVPFDPLNLPQNLKVDQPSIMQLFANNLKYQQLGQEQDVASASEASNLTGIAVRLPANLSGTPKISVQPGTKLSFKVDLPRIQALLNDAGFKDIQLPKQLDGTTVNAELPMIVTAMYGDFQAAGPVMGHDPDIKGGWCPDCTVLVQLASPTIDTPEGVDLAAIGKAYLRLTGMTAAEADSFSQTVDWSTTLVIPVPNFTTHQTVSVDGVNGVFIQQNQQYSSQYVLIWVKGGIVYGLTGYGSQQSALDIANSLK